MTSHSLKERFDANTSRRDTWLSFS